MAILPAATPAQIAEAAGLHERYVREWLGAMAVGRIVEYDAVLDTYHLPAEHAAALTRAAAPNNLAAFTQYIPQLGAVEDGVLHAFRNGGGVPYADFKRFHEIMAEDSGQSVLPALFDHILPLIPGVEAALAAGIDVLDLGCGVGKALMLLAERYPNSRFTGYDFSDEAIRRAGDEAARKGLANLHFAVVDAAQFNEARRYDLICTFDAIHDQARPDVALRNGGVYLMQDIAGSSQVHKNFDHPIGPFLYTISTMHCMTVSLAYGGMGLGAMWGKEKALEMLAAAGFRQVQVHDLAHDIQNCYYVVRK
jgi:SAM-dependent methyltransferase